MLSCLIVHSSVVPIAIWGRTITIATFVVGCLELERVRDLFSGRGVGRSGLRR